MLLAVELTEILRGTSLGFLELPVEVGDVVESCRETDLGDGLVRVDQFTAGLGDAQVNDVVGDVLPRAGLEEARERGFRHAGDLRDILQGDRPGVVTLNVVANLADPLGCTFSSRLSRPTCRRGLPSPDPVKVRRADSGKSSSCRNPWSRWQGNEAKSALSEFVATEKEIPFRPSSSILLTLLNWILFNNEPLNVSPANWIVISLTMPSGFILPFSQP